MSLGGLAQSLREQLHATHLAQSSYLRPDDPQTRRLRRFWWRKKKALGSGYPVAPVYDDEEDALRAQRQRNLMDTGSADPIDPAED